MTSRKRQRSSPSQPSDRPLAPDWPIGDPQIMAALQTVFASGDWGRYQGQQCEQLERDLRDYHQVDHVWLCCSGTIGVELALRGLDVRPGDEVVLAGYDFPGNFRAVESIGARPVLVDITPSTWCISAELVSEAFTSKTKAVIVSHLHGGLADLPSIVEQCQERAIGVVEDACQATGACLGGRRAGTWGDVGVLSFGGSKLLTSGRGGAILTPRADVFQRIKVYSERGNQAFPLSELQATVLRPQLAQLDPLNKRRDQSVKLLLQELRTTTSLIPVKCAGTSDQSSFYKLAFRLAPTAHGNGPNRDLIAATAQARGLALHAGFRGFVNRSNRRCRVATKLSHSQAAAEHTLILHHPLLLQPEKVIRRAAEILRQCVNEPDAPDPPTASSNQPASPS